MVEVVMKEALRGARCRGSNWSRGALGRTQGKNYTEDRETLRATGEIWIGGMYWSRVLVGGHGGGFYTEDPLRSHEEPQREME